MDGWRGRMTFDDLVHTVTGYAPTLGSALGGPLGGLVGTLISSVFGGSTKNPADLIQKITADPQADIKLKELEYAHADELAKVSVSKYQIEVDDRKNAREREIELAKIGKLDTMPHIIAFMILGSVIGIVFAQFIPGINTSNAALIGQISGMLTREMIEICKYYYGSNSEIK